MRIDGIGNWVLLIMAAASLISMLAAFSLEGIVSNDLDAYGLQFSYSWAIPYWNSIGTIFAMAWLNIIAVIAFQIYRFRAIRKEERQSAEEQFEETFENGYRKIYGITIIADQTAMHEADEPVQIIPYEPVTCEQTESGDPKQTEK
jgi:hypothetical protein